MFARVINLICYFNALVICNHAPPCTSPPGEGLEQWGKTAGIFIVSLPPAVPRECGGFVFAPKYNQLVCPSREGCEIAEILTSVRPHSTGLLAGIC